MGEIMKNHFLIKGFLWGLSFCFCLCNSIILRASEKIEEERLKQARQQWAPEHKDEQERLQKEEKRLADAKERARDLGLNESVLYGAHANAARIHFNNKTRQVETINDPGTEAFYIEQKIKEEEEHRAVIHQKKKEEAFQAAQQKSPEAKIISKPAHLPKPNVPTASTKPTAIKQPETKGKIEQWKDKARSMIPSRGSTNQSPVQSKGSQSFIGKGITRFQKSKLGRGLKNLKEKYL